MQAGYRLRAAETRDLEALPEIERRAATLFADRGFPKELWEATRSPEEFAEGLADGGLWVAVDPEERPVGFALVASVDGVSHLEEIDVDPDHARKGIGRALVEEVCADARRRGRDFVTLTTYADVPWNAPWYERQGFRVLGRGELDPGLARVVADEAETLPAPERRVAMRRRVSHGGSVLRWMASVWLSGVVALSLLASDQPRTVLPWTQMLPGRDKTGHFLLMGGLALFAVLAFAGRSVRGRRISTPMVFAVVVAIVLIEEGVQWWLPLRNFSLVDLASSLGGVAVFGGIAIGWRAHRTQPPQR
jgi:ribosomal protein S18 acetylase RimI-like enzyme/VanZ family protein